MGENRIALLASDVIDHIAAGEVVERPASAVKELIENALDAGATAVQVDLRGGGLEQIVISDDGCGMSVEDARLCVLRHATSKLRGVDDLFRIETLGFRGEALSSIAAVSHLTLTTRPKDAAVGYRLAMVGGVLQSEEAIGCPPGTTIAISELFFNTPARRKFMRAPATEQTHVVEATLRVMLGARRGGVVVTSGSRRLLDIPDVGAGEGERIMAALGNRLESLHPFASEAGGVRVSGFISPPQVDRADSKGVWLFVNGRFVRDRVLQRAVMDAYETTQVRGRYPTVIVYVDVPPDVVDVNVHPQKLEVRFADSGAIFRVVSQSLTVALASAPWSQSPSASGTQAAVHSFFARHASAQPVAEHQHQSLRPAYRAAASRDTPRPGAMGAPESFAGVDALPIAPCGPLAALRLLDVVLGGFLICTTADALVVIDGHAGAALVAKERLAREVECGEIARQALLFPEIFEVPSEARAWMEHVWDGLSTYGFEVEPVGPGRYGVRAIPAALASAEVLPLVHDFLAALRDGTDTRQQVLERCAVHAAGPVSGAAGTAGAMSLLAQLDALGWDLTEAALQGVVLQWGVRDLRALLR